MNSAIFWGWGKNETSLEGKTRKRNCRQIKNNPKSRAHNFNFRPSFNFHDYKKFIHMRRNVTNWALVGEDELKIQRRASGNFRSTQLCKSCTYIYIPTPWMTATCYLIRTSLQSCSQMYEWTGIGVPAGWPFLTRLRRQERNLLQLAFSGT